MAENNNEYTTKVKADVTDFKSGMQQAKREIRLANAEFKAASSSMDHWEKSTDGLRAKLKQLDSVLSSEERQLSLLKQQYSKVAQEQGESSKGAQELMIKVKNQEAQVNKTKNSITKYTKELNDLDHESDDVAHGLNKVDKELDDVANGSNKAAIASGTLKEGLKKAAKIGAAALAASVVAVSKALVDGIRNTAQYADNIDKMSQKMGLSSTKYQEWEFIMQHSGTSMETLKASMKTLANAANKNNEAFSKLGITQEEVANLSQEELFERTIKGLQEVGDSTERTYLAGQLLGRGATELGALLNTSAEDTEKMRQQVHELGGVLDEEAVKAGAAFQDSLQNLQYASKGFGRTLSAEFLPSVTKTMDGIAALFTKDSDKGFGLIEQGVQEFVDTLLTKIPEGISKLGDIVGLLVSVIVKAIGTLAEQTPQIIQSLLDSFSKFADKLPELIPDITRGLFDIIRAIVASFPEWISAMGNLTDKVWDSLLIFIDMVIDELPWLITDILDAVTKSLPVYIKAMISIMKKIVDALPQIIQSLVDALPLILDAIIDFLIECTPELLIAAGELFMALVEGLFSIREDLTQGILDLIAAVIQWLIDKGIELYDAGVTFFQNIIQVITDKYEEFKEQVRLFFEAIPEKLGEAVGNALAKLYNFGQDIITFVTVKIPEFIQTVADYLANLPETIKLKLDLAKQKVSDWFGELKTNATTGAQEFVDTIRQKIEELPDKMKEIGDNIVSGLWDGIVAAKDWLKSKIESFSEGIEVGFKDALGIHSPSRVMRDKVGKWIPPGIAEGITQNAKVVKTAIHKLTASATEEAQNLLGSNISWAPQLAAAGGYNGGKTVVFNQYNQSPKPLNRLEIYRQTKNQLRGFEEND